MFFKLLKISLLFIPIFCSKPCCAQNEELNKEMKEVEIEDVRPIKEEFYESKYGSLIYNDAQLETIINIIKESKFGIEVSEEKLAALSEAELQAEQEELRKSVNVFLNAIMYVSDKVWTIWVNDQKRSSFEEDLNESEMQILSVSKDSVKFLWKMSKTKWLIMMPGFDFENSITTVNERNEVETIFTLRPNQTFVPRTGEVIEGRRKPELEEGEAEGTEVEGEVLEGQ